MICTHVDEIHSQLWSLGNTVLIEVLQKYKFYCLVTTVRYKYWNKFNTFQGQPEVCWSIYFYLWYVQHNFPDNGWKKDEKAWNYVGFILFKFDLVNFFWSQVIQVLCFKLSVSRETQNSLQSKSLTTSIDNTIIGLSQDCFWHLHFWLGCCHSPTVVSPDLQSLCCVKIFWSEAFSFQWKLSERKHSASSAQSKIDKWGR